MIHLNSTVISCDTSAVCRIKDSSWNTTTEGPQGKPHRVISSCYERKCEKMVRSWWMNPEIGLETFLKAQIAESGVIN